MRSLTLKLVLAFLATSIAGVMLASLFIRQAVTREFDDYVIAQHRADVIDLLSRYHERYGSWQGLEHWLRNALVRLQVDQFPVVSPRRRFVPFIRFVLVDPNGIVIIPFKPYRIGDQVDAAILARGTPVLAHGNEVGRLLTPDRSAFRNPAEEVYLARTDHALLGAAIVMVGVALILGILLARLITQPVRELTSAAQKIADGDLEQQVIVRSRDELGVLAAQFNHMSADLARATHLRRRMTADIAHDLRTPLTVIAGYLEALRDQVLKPTSERFAIMHDETQLLLHLVDDLHTLSLADAGELHLDYTAIAPYQLLERVAETYRRSAEQNGVTVSVEADNTLPTIRIDHDQMIRVLSNLISNALRHTSQGGAVRLIAQTDSTALRLMVADNGVGIAPEHMPNIFERFYRADVARQQTTGGSGLGLAIAKSIVEGHNGHISVESTPTQGTLFTIRLPLEC